jgi:hypothetical protein
MSFGRERGETCVYARCERQSKMQTVGSAPSQTKARSQNMQHAQAERTREFSRHGTTHFDGRGRLFSFIDRPIGQSFWVEIWNL